MINRIAPENITSLQDNEIFVFGSNLAENHGHGAAKDALMKFGAWFGKGDGKFGRSYAIPTKDAKLNVLTISQIKSFVDTFINFASNHPELIFKVSKIGCGLAGYSPEQIAPLFSDAVFFRNIHLPVEFWDKINELNEQRD